MADFNMNTTLSNLNTVNGFVRENPVHPHQKSQKMKVNEGSTELAGRQVFSAKKPSAIEEPSVSKQFSITEQSIAGVVKDFQQEELDETIAQINDSLQNIQRNLKFSVDNDSGIVVINVTDKVTDKLVRQIPSEEVLELARNLQEMNLNLPDPSGERSESHSRSRTEGVFLKTSV